MQTKFVTRVSSFFSPSTVTGGQTGKSYILFCLCTFSFATPRPAQKRNVACLRSMSCVGTTKRLEETRIEDTPRVITHVAHPTYSASSGILVVSHKAKYARLRTLPRSLVGSRGSSFQPCFSATANKRFCLLVSYER